MRCHPTSTAVHRWHTLAIGALAFTIALAACGATQPQWETLQTDGQAHVITLAPDAHNPNAVYVGTDGGQIYRVFASGTGQPVASHGDPYGARITALLSDPARAGDVYAGTDQGVWRSQDGGQNWAFYGNGLPNDTILSLASANAGVLLAGMGRLGIYRSKDGGATWAKVGLPVFASVGVRALLCIGSACYAGLAQSQAEINLYLSADGGQTWAPGSTGHAEAINALASLPAPSPSTQSPLFAATTHGLRESVDGGAQWSASAVGLPGIGVTTLARSPAQPHWLLASVNQTVYRSTDDGRHWSILAAGPGGLGASVTGVAVATSPQTGAVVFAAAGQLARYPGVADGNSNPLATIIALLILLALLPLIFFRTRVSFQRFREDRMPRRQPPAEAATSAGGASAGATSSGETPGANGKQMSSNANVDMSG